MFILSSVSIITKAMFILSSVSSALEFGSVNHISIYQNSKLKVFKPMKGF